jgi:hypothetical protein
MNKVSVKLLYYLVAVEHLDQSSIEKLNNALIAEKPQTIPKVQRIIDCFFDKSILVKQPKIDFGPLVYNTITYDLKGKLNDHKHFNQIRKNQTDFFSSLKIQSIPDRVILILQ